MLYTETDLENSMSKIDTINFHQEIEIEGIKFWCYHGRNKDNKIKLLLKIVFICFSWACIGCSNVYDRNSWSQSMKKMINFNNLFKVLEINSNLLDFIYW